MTQLIPAASPLGAGRSFANLWPQHESRATLAWRAGFHAPGGVALTKRLVRELATSRSDVLLDLSPATGRAIDEVMRRPHRPAVRMALVEADGEPRHDDKYTLRREGTPSATGLVVGSVDLVLAQGLTRRRHPEDGWLAEAGRVLRSDGRLALHELAGTRAGASHPLETGGELLTTTGWQRTLDRHGLVVEQMWTAAWQWPSIWSVVRGAGAGAWWVHQRRWRKLATSWHASRLVGRDDILGVAIIARRR